MAATFISITGSRHADIIMDHDNTAYAGTRNAHIIMDENAAYAGLRHTDITMDDNAAYATVV